MKEKEYKRNLGHNKNVWHACNKILNWENKSKKHWIKRNIKGFPGDPVVKNLPASAGDMDLIPGPGRFHILWDN